MLLSTLKYKLYFLSILLLPAFGNVHAKENEVVKKRKEWFFLGVAPVYSLGDETYGLNFKAGIPMQKNFYFVAQGTTIPNLFEHPFEEYRYEFNIELIPLRIKNFYIYGTAGLNFGYWKRKNDGIYLNPSDEFFNDNSLMFGGGMSFDLGRFEIFSEFKSYPEIWANHGSLGLKIKFYENKKLRNKYYKFLQQRSDKSSER